MILKQNEINKAALNNDKSIDRIDGFKSGAKWAESKFEELAIEFIEWCGENRVTLTTKDKREEFQQVWHQGKNISTKELFKQFIKERNGKIFMCL